MNESKNGDGATDAVDVPDIEKQDIRESNLCLSGGEDVKSIAVSPIKGYLSRSGSSQEQCRICQQEKEESLIDLGCQCRGGLAKAHRPCIETWFRTRGSNICEICQQVAQNVSPPESQPNADYWVWRIDPTMRTQDRERGCFSPLWVAFSILIGGLLLDVLISITFGVSALPVNIIIGVIIVLGLGTALRLALEFCHEWGLRRAVQRVETNVSHGYHPAVCWLACVHQPLTMVSPIAFVCSQPLWSLVFVLEEILPALLCTGSCKSQYALLPQLDFANLNSEASDGGTQTVVLKVRMCCTGCERVVKNAIYKLKGIDSVEVELEMERVTVVGYVDRNKVLKAVRRAGKRAEFWPYPNPPLYFTSSYNYFNDTASDFKESYNYYRHGYNMADKHGTIHVSQRGDDKVSNFFNDDNVNACSVM